MKELISVIVPVYNVEDYLMRCVDSLTGQTYKNIEIILVDDGSTDRSGDMCDYYEKEDNRIRVIHQENGGQSKARNKALDIAKGEYYCFVDSDDYVANDYVEKLYKALKDNDADMSYCDFIKFTGESADGAFDKVEESTIITKTSTELLKIMHLEPDELYVVVWGKLFKKELFEGIRFPEGRICEDLAILYKLYKRVNKAISISDILYYYFRNNVNSSTYSINEKFYKDVFLTLEEEIEFFKNENIDLLDYPKRTYMYWIMDYYIKLYKNGEQAKLSKLHKKYKSLYKGVKTIKLEKFFKAFCVAPKLYIKLKR